MITQCYSLDNQLHCSLGKQLRARVFHTVLQDPSVHSYIERHMVPQRLAFTISSRVATAQRT